MKKYPGIPAADRSSITKWEKQDGFQGLSIEKLQEIADAINVDLSEFFIFEEGDCKADRTNEVVLNSQFKALFPDIYLYLDLATRCLKANNKEAARANIEQCLKAETDKHDLSKKKASRTVK